MTSPLGIKTVGRNGSASPLQTISGMFGLSSSYLYLVRLLQTIWQRTDLFGTPTEEITQSKKATRFFRTPRSPIIWLSIKWFGNHTVSQRLSFLTGISSKAKSSQRKTSEKEASLVPLYVVFAEQLKKATSTFFLNAPLPKAVGSSSLAP